MDSLATALAQIPAASDQVAEARAKAREAAVRAIRAVEAELVAALNGEHLRGLPNLGNRRTGKVYALRVRSSVDNDSQPVACDEGPLVLHKDGTLAVVELVDDVLIVRAAEDSELLVEDLEQVLSKVRWAVIMHVAAVGRSSARFNLIAETALRVLKDIEVGSRNPGSGAPAK